MPAAQLVQTIAQVVAGELGVDHVHVVQSDTQTTPYERTAKGAGEGSLNPVGPAIASAVARAVGGWPSRLPLTPERVCGR